MFDDRSDSEAKAVGRQAVPRDDEKQAAERRWLQDALEDDEVYEALTALRTKKEKQEQRPGEDRPVSTNSG
jgi:hypothetical protein